MTSSPLRIVFAGTPEFAAVSLKALLNSSHRVVAAYTQPDRPAGRGKRLQPSAVKQLALEHAVSVEQPLNFKDPAAVQTLADYQPDVMVVVAYGLLLPKAVLELPRYGCLNVHASLLPRWRGAAPIQRAIAAGDANTGITIMQMDEGLDTGPMLHRVTTPILADDTAASLHERLAALGGDALLATLDQLTHVTPAPQPKEGITYARKLSKAEAEIDWLAGAQFLQRQVRAFNPWPVSFTLLNGKRVRIWRAQALPQPDHPTHAGEILAAEPHGIDVATGEGVLRLLQLQPEGGKPLTCQQLLNARREEWQPGTRLGVTADAVRQQR